MFGEAAPEIKKYYEKLNGDFSGAADLPYLIAALDKAAGATKNTQVQNRIEKLQAYVHYLVLYYQWQSAPADKKTAGWENLMEYVWKIYPLRVVHSTRIAELMNARAASNAALVKAWNVYAPGENVKATKFITGKELSELVKKDKENYPLLPGFNYTKSPSALSYVIKPAAAPEEANPEGMLLVGLSGNLYPARP